MVGTTVYYLHQDALGNTRLETTTTVSVKFSSNYVPYGKNYAVSGKEVFMYTGKPYDSATGLYYEGARYYDPTTGRFITQDSITGVQEDPMSLNRYIYARDNPMKIVDLAGHEWWNPISDITSAASTASSGISAVAGDVSNVASGVVNVVSTGVSDVAGAVSNAWNSLPPSEQQAVVVGVAIAAVAVTGGLAAPVIAPVAFGAAFSVGANLATGLYSGDASVAGVVTAAAIGGASGAGSIAFSSVAGSAVVGSITTFVNQQANSLVKTGHWQAPSVDSVIGDVFGGVIGAAGSGIGGYFGSNTVKASIISGLTTTVASQTAPSSIGPLEIRPYTAAYRLSGLGIY